MLRAAQELMCQNSEKLAESFTDGEGKTTHYEYGAFDLLTAHTSTGVITSPTRLPMKR